MKEKKTNIKKGEKIEKKKNNEDVTKKEETKSKAKVKLSKNRVIFLVVSLIIIIAIILGLTVFNSNWKDASHDFKVVSNKLERMNNELDSLIAKSEKIVKTKDKALEEEKRAILKGTISDAKEKREDVLRKPLLTKNIENATSKMEEIDYTEIVKLLEEKYNDFDKSIKQYKLVDNPTEKYLLSRLKNVKGI